MVAGEDLLGSGEEPSLWARKASEPLEKLQALHGILSICPWIFLDMLLDDGIDGSDIFGGGCSLVPPCKMLGPFFWGKDQSTFGLSAADPSQLLVDSKMIGSQTLSWIKIIPVSKVDP